MTWGGGDPVLDLLLYNVTKYIINTPNTHFETFSKLFCFVLFNNSFWYAFHGPICPVQQQYYVFILVTTSLHNENFVVLIWHFYWHRFVHL